MQRDEVRPQSFISCQGEGEKFKSQALRLLRIFGNDKTTSGDPERIRQSIEASQACNTTDSEVQWRLLRAYANYHSELTELDPAEQKWVAEDGYAFARSVDAAESSKAEIVYYYASIGIRYLDYHRVKALVLGRHLMKTFAQARQLNPAIDDAGPDRNLGVLYLEVPWPVRNKDKALHHLRDAVKLAPQRAANRYWLAKVLAKKGLYEEGWEHIQFIRAGKFDVSSDHWRDLYVQRVEELAKSFPQNK